MKNFNIVTYASLNNGSETPAHTEMVNMPKFKRCRFVIALCSGNKEITGYLFTFKGVKMVAHKSQPDGDFWRISDYHTGLGCNHFYLCQTRKAAVSGLFQKWETTSAEAFLEKREQLAANHPVLNS